jgi:hypothetical protein
MSPAETHALIRDVNADIARMARAAQMQREIREAILFRANYPLEEQLIDEDSFGLPRGEPRVVRWGNVKLKIWKIHRAGLRATDIKGADLYYEIADTKFVLIQYKSASATGRVTRDAEQLAVLKESCPNLCSPPNRFSCGSWLALRDASEATYHPACEADRIFGTFASRGKSAFINGLTRSQFHTDFGECRIGGRTNPINLDAYKASSIEADHLFLQVEQTYL